MTASNIKALESWHRIFDYVLERTGEYDRAARVADHREYGLGRPTRDADFSEQNEKLKPLWGQSILGNIFPRVDV